MNCYVTGTSFSLGIHCLGMIKNDSLEKLETVSVFVLGHFELSVRCKNLASFHEGHFEQCMHC